MCCFLVDEFVSEILIISGLMSFLGDTRDEDWKINLGFTFFIYIFLGLNLNAYEDGWILRRNRRKKMKEKSRVGGALLDPMVLHDQMVYFVLKWLND